MSNHDNKCFHLAGDGRAMPKMNAERHAGDYLITVNLQHVYKIMPDGGNKKVEGVERDAVIAQARSIRDLMVLHAVEQDKARGKRPPIKAETVEQNIRRLKKEMEQGKHKLQISDGNESVH